MTLLDSLLDAIVRLEGDALVMHVGEKPYVVTTSAAMSQYRGPLAWGQVELSSRILTSEAVLGMIGQILPSDLRQTLDDLGAIEQEIAPPAGSADRFTVIAARGGEDVFLELRRRPPVEEPAAAAEPIEEAPAEEAAPIAAAEPPEEAIAAASPIPHDEAVSGVSEVAQEQEEEVPLEIVPEVLQELLTDADVNALLAASAAALLEPSTPAHEEAPIVADEVSAPAAEAEPQPIVLEAPAIPEPEEPPIPTAAPIAQAEEPPPIAREPSVVPEPEPSPVVAESPVVPEPAQLPMVAEAPVLREPEQPSAAVEPPHPGTVEVEPQPIVVERPQPIAEQKPEPIVVEAARPPVAAVDLLCAPPLDVHASESIATEPEEQAVTSAPAAMEQPPVSAQSTEPEREPRAIVVPIARSAVRPDSPAVAAASPGDGQVSVVELLRVAAARGASAVYVVAQSPPMARSDGEITALEIGSGAPLTESDVNRLVLELAPSAARDAWQRGAATEWMCDVADVGPVRCVTFRDHRGPGVLFRMVPPRAILADQLALTPEIRALCTQSDGLVIVTGPRASGKSTLLTAFIDLINRTGSDHVITIESQIAFAHESRRSFVSQREVRGDSDAVVSAIRGALREDPDVLLIEDLRSPEVASVAFEAAESGRLVFGALPAASTVAAVTRLVEMFPHDRRSQAQAALAGTLRGVVAQVLLRRSKGGRIAAREILVNTPAIAALLEEGKTAQLPLAMEGGRRHGMMPLNDALASFVQDGTVHITEAYLKAFDKEGLLATLERQVGDTGLAERLA